MHAIVIEHVDVNDLPELWRDRLHAKSNTRVTIRIEEETSEEEETFVTDDPAFGIWRDRVDIADTNTYVRELRAPRFTVDGSRKED